MNTPTAPALVLYAPALNEPSGSGAIDGVAQRLARTLDLQSQPVGASYRVREAAPESYGSGGVAEVREVLRLDPGQAAKEAVVTHRLYHLNYLPALDDPATPNVLVQTGRLVLLWFTMMLRFVGPLLLAEALSKRQKTAVLAAAACLGLITLYVGLALLALVYVVLNVTAPGAGAAPGDVPGLLAQLDALLEPVFSQRWVQLVAVAGAFGLTFGKVRAALDAAARTYLRFGRYMESAETRATCTGMFNELLEHLLGQESSRVDVVAYSFGSLMTLDALFPADGQPTDRAARVQTLTTIGCPFDLIRTFWPRHFAERAVNAAGLRWLNVFSPVDLLGSNFANDDGLKQPDRGINFATPFGKAAATEPAAVSIRPEQNLFYDPMGRRDLGLIDALLGGALRAHSQYWVPGQPAAESCYKRFVPLLYPA